MKVEKTEMKKIDVTPDSGFQIVGKTELSQAATMVLSPGDSTGGPNNRHSESDQWLYVRSGKGIAKVEDQKYVLNAGTWVLIERGETHEIQNTGAQDLETINVYAPPAY